MSGVHVKLANRRQVTDADRAEFEIGSSRSTPKINSCVRGDVRSEATWLTLSVDVGLAGSNPSAKTIPLSRSNSSRCVTPSPLKSIA